MNADEYLEIVLNREAVNTGPLLPVRDVQGKLNPIISKMGWQPLSPRPS
jgi:hypothetical protein